MTTYKKIYTSKTEAIKQIVDYFMGFDIFSMEVSAFGFIATDFLYELKFRKKEFEIMKQWSDFKELDVMLELPEIKVFLDDERNPSFIEASKFASESNAPWTVVRSAEQACNLIRTGKVTHISLDHDLGTEKTGYDVAKTIEFLAYNGKIPRLNWNVHSQNPVGKDNIVKALLSANRYWSLKE